MACLACIFQSPSEGILNVHNMQMGPLSCSPLPQKARCLITTTGSGAMPSFFFFFFFLNAEIQIVNIVRCARLAWARSGWHDLMRKDMTLWGSNYAMTSLLHIFSSSRYYSAWVRSGWHNLLPYHAIMRKWLCIQPTSSHLFLPKILLVSSLQVLVNPKVQSHM